MIRHNRQRAGKLLLIAVGGAAVTLFACINPFAPTLVESGFSGDLMLTGQRTPEEVLQNFQYAYVLKDSLVYRDLLDEDYTFVWRDHENDRFVSWTKEEDVRSTVGLFGGFNVINLVWNSTNYETWSTDSTEAEISKQFILTLDSDIRITGDAQFYFRKLESGIWKIIRWVDKSIV